ncbi:MAG: hypothetical protein ACWA41_03585 [Putridiphycobacter sp.]
MKKVKLIILTLFLGLTVQTSANDFDVSPDGNTIAYSAGNYVIYLLDAKTFEVKKRLRTEKNPDVNFNSIYSFSPDGKSFMYGAAWDLYVLNTETWTIKRKIKKEGDVYLSPDKSKFLMYDEKKITIYDMNSANITKTFMVDMDEDDVQEVTFSLDNKKLILLSDEVDSEKEEKVKYSYKDFDGLSEKEELEKRRKNDGKEMSYTIIDIETGKAERTKTIWYSSNSMEVVPLPEGKFLLGSRDGLVEVNDKDELKVYNVEGGSNYQYDAANNLVVYTTSFSGVYVFNFEFVNKFDLKNNLVSFVDKCVVYKGIYYISFNEYCIGSCTKDGTIVSPVPIY